MTLFNDDGTEMTADQLEVQIASLKAELILARKRSELSCPLCGSRLTKSTKFDRFFCAQDYGLCGELRVGVKRRTPFHFEHFLRTCLNPDGSFFKLNCDDNGLRLNRFFIGDREVSQEEYSGKSKSPDLEVTG